MDDPCNCRLADSASQSGNPSAWNFWDDFLAGAHKLDAPDSLPVGSTSIARSYVDRPGFVDPDLECRKGK